MSAERVHLITGEDDVVVGQNGAEKLQQHLLDHQIPTSLNRPKKLPHHRPDEGAIHIFSDLRDLFPLSNRGRFDPMSPL